MENVARQIVSIDENQEEFLVRDGYKPVLSLVARGIFWLLGVAE